MRHLDRADLLIELGRWTEARREVSAALATEPDSFRAMCLLATCLLELDEPQEALEATATAIGLCPEDEWGYRVRSYVLAVLDRHEEAVAAAREAVRIDPDEPLTQATLARALLRVPDGLTEASAVVEQALALDPSDPELHVLAGRVAGKLGDVGAARAAYQRGLRLDPQDVEALNGLANLENTNLQLGSALRTEATALSLNPTESLHVRNIETFAENLVMVAYLVGVYVTVAAALPLAVLAALEAGDVVDLGWLRGVLGLVALVAYVAVSGRIFGSQPAVARRFLLRKFVRLPTTEPRITFLVVVPAWTLFAGVALLPATRALVAAALEVALFAIVLKTDLVRRSDDQV